MRILIADDHPFMRRGIGQTLREVLSHVEIDEAPDGSVAFDLIAARDYDLAIVDVAMPRKDGLELIKEALALKPTLRFLVMSVYSEREFAERAYRSGAKGYLSKVGEPEELIEAVRRILGGKTYVSPDYADLLVQGLGHRQDEITRLSDRELAVLRLFATGMTLTEIGRELHLSAKTVSTYKTRVMEKLALSTNADLMAYALKKGLR